MADTPRVFLVGAGPGNPGLLTLRAVECLSRADLVIYDKLVPPIMLEHAPVHAERICITEFGPRHCERIITVTQKLIEAAKEGKCVVRLKGGDPLLFGRGSEEAEALRAAGIPFEIVPGITAALGASAFAGIPLTHRGVSSAVALITGHSDPEDGETDLEWHALAQFPGTLAIYMGLARLSAIAQALIEQGKPADTPAAVIQLATMGEQRTIVAPLHEIASAVQTAGLTSPSLILIGPVIALRDNLSWFEQRPLFGRRILVCRPREQAADLMRRLEEQGAICIALPVLEVHPPADWTAVDAAIQRLAEFQWLVFTSVNGVHAFIGRLFARGLDLRALGHISLAAIGPVTADALRSYHLTADLVPEVFCSENLAAMLKPHVGGQRMLTARADRGRDTLRQELESISDVHEVAVYSQSDVSKTDPRVLELFRKGEIDWVILTSANSARSLAHLLDEECQAQIRSGRTRIVSISPVTSAAIKELVGWPIAAEATEFTMTGVVAALIGFGKS